MGSLHNKPTSVLSKPLSRRSTLKLAGGAMTGMAVVPLLSDRSVAAAPTKIRLAHNVSMVSAPIFVAVRTGMFNDAKLDVDAKAFPSGRTMVTALAGGSIDIADGIAEQPPVLAWSRGLDFRCIGAEWNGLTGFFVRPKSGIKSVQDLKGKRIGIPLGTGIEIQARQELRNAGLKNSDYNAVGIQMQNLVATLIAGRVDCIAASFPQPYVAVAKGQLDLLQSFGADEPQLVVTLAPPAFIQNNRDAVVRFVKVVYEASKRLEANDKAALQAVVDNYHEQGVEFTVDAVSKLTAPPNLTVNLGPGKTAVRRLTVVAKKLLTQNKIKAIPNIKAHLETELWKRATGTSPT